MATSVTASAEMQPHHLHLSRDKKLQKLIAEIGLLELPGQKNVFLALISSIMSQQLSVKVAAVIYKRFLELYPDGEPSPRQVLDTPDPTLRSIGLSNAKVSYVKNVSKFALEKGMDNELLSGMDSEAIIDYLVEIKGVGRWTVEMLLMFALGRADHFSLDDLGIQNAMIGLFKLDRSNKKQFYEAMTKRAAKWAPYRSYACLYLWRWKPEQAAVKVVKEGSRKTAKKVSRKTAKKVSRKDAK